MFYAIYKIKDFEWITVLSQEHIIWNLKIFLKYKNVNISFLPINRNYEIKMKS